MGKFSIPIFDVFVDDDSLGLTAVSLVDMPAISEDFIAMSKAVQRLWFNKEKHEVVGPLLIPNQLILRYAEDGSAYYIRWGKETIKKAADKYLMQGRFNNITIMHEDIDKDDSERMQDNVYLKKMWIINDAKSDIANVQYGYHLPEGTLMAKYKVYNRSIWQRIKSGELRGFSIEAIASLQNVNKMLEIQYNKMEKNKIEITDKALQLWDKFVMFVNQSDVASDADALAGEAKKDETDSGEVTIKYWTDNDHYLSVDAEGFVRDEEGNLVDTGQYKLSDGNVLEVGEDNKFVGVHAAADAKDDAEPAEAPIAEAEDDKDKTSGETSCNEKVDEVPSGETSGDTEVKEEDAEDKASGDTKADADSDEADDMGDDKNPDASNEEEPEEPELPSDLVPFELDGEQYLIPQPVADYINSLVGTDDKLQEEMAQLKAKTPSAKPIGSVVKQAKEKKETYTYTLSDAIRRLNWRKE